VVGTNTTQFLPNVDEPFDGFTGPIPFRSSSTDNPTFAFQNRKGDITALVTMLQTNGLATILAQPKILAMSGQNAVFQVGVRSRFGSLRASRPRSSSRPSGRS
jgi:type II secretory pathway component GspD/PulD (secretin)